MAIRIIELKIKLKQPFERFRVTTGKLKELGDKDADASEIHCVWYPVVEAVRTAVRRQPWLLTAIESFLKLA